MRHSVSSSVSLLLLASSALRFRRLTNALPFSSRKVILRVVSGAAKSVYNAAVCEEASRVPCLLVIAVHILSVSNSAYEKHQDRESGERDESFHCQYSLRSVDGSFHNINIASST